jgi:hypothetical protein
MTKLEQTTEHTHTINGVKGRMYARIPRHPDALLYAAQKWVATRPCPSIEKRANIHVELRFDDHCGNGRQTFNITWHIAVPGGRDWITAGCRHEEIAEYFPELVPLIKWHLVSTDGPMHYIANTTYHASNRDYNGLLKGETRQIRKGNTGALCWKLKPVDDEPPRYYTGDTPPADVIYRYMPLCHVGEGKERDSAAARNAACWPEATEEQLSLPKEELTALLTARLPALMAEFRKDMEACGFIWAEVTKS